MKVDHCAHCGEAIAYADNDGTYRDQRGGEVCADGWPGGYPRLHEPLV